MPVMRSKYRALFLIIAIVVALSMITVIGCAPEADDDPVDEEPEPEVVEEEEEEEEEEVDEEKVLRLRYGAGTTGLDPNVSPYASDSSIIGQIHNALLRFTLDGDELEPDLAEDWEVCDDLITFTFYLREDVQWQFGKGELTAHDVKNHYERILDPDAGAIHRSFYEIIDEIEVIDDYTVAFTMRAAGEPNIYRFAGFRSGFIIHTPTAEETDYAQNPVGTGPFQLVEFEPRELTVVEPNPDYFGEDKPKIDRIEWPAIPEVSVAVMALETGEIDGFIAIPDADAYNKFKEDPDYEVHEITSTNVIGIGFNLTAEPYDDVRVRRAVAHLIDNDLIVEHVLGGMGKASVSHIAPNYPYATDTGLPEYPYDPETAGQLLQEAGITQLDAVLRSDRDRDIEIFTLLQDELRQLGVDLDIELVERGAYDDMRPGGEFRMTNWGFSPRPDPDILLAGTLHSEAFPPGFNWPRYTGVDDLIDEGGIAPPARRAEIYPEIQKILMEDLPAYPIYHAVLADVVRSEVTGYRKPLYPNYRYWLVDIVR